MALQKNVFGKIGKKVTDWGIPFVISASLIAQPVFSEEATNKNNPSNTPNKSTTIGYLYDVQGNLQSHTAESEIRNKDWKINLDYRHSSSKESKETSEVLSDPLAGNIRINDLLENKSRSDDVRLEAERLFSKYDSIGLILGYAGARSIDTEKNNINFEFYNKKYSIDTIAEAGSSLESFLFGIDLKKGFNLSNGILATNFVYDYISNSRQTRATTTQRQKVYKKGVLVSDTTDLETETEKSKNKASIYYGNAAFLPDKGRIDFVSLGYLYQDKKLGARQVINPAILIDLKENTKMLLSGDFGQGYEKDLCWKDKIRINGGSIDFFMKADNKDILDNVAYNIVRKYEREGMDAVLDNHVNKYRTDSKMQLHLGYGEEHGFQDRKILETGIKYRIFKNVSLVYNYENIRGTEKEDRHTIGISMRF